MTVPLPAGTAGCGSGSATGPGQHDGGRGKSHALVAQYDVQRDSGAGQRQQQNIPEERS
ncbi:Uncharacterized protein pbN1_30720 [Aromatoleum bremense]|nr:Uncharacterized protein pbN1_30720 [Aromatoleum bremense]